MDEIYLVYENADSTEGRGPMVIVKNSGFFTSEKAAWDFADTIPGVMGRKPANGSWRDEPYGDVEVRKFLKHNSEKAKLRIKIQSQIDILQQQLKDLESTE